VRRFTREELLAHHGETVPDLIGPDLRLLFVGINPGLWTAAVQAHFAHPANRFYPALLAGGLLDRPIRAADGMTEEDKAYFTGRGLGITNLVPHATARAAEVSVADLRTGRKRLTVLVEARRPRVVAVCGITAYRSAFGRRWATPGKQPEPIGDAELWVVPNPSGLNAHENITSLGAAYRAAAIAAGLC
jgi:TDG/mug DNA glycosylase family protein